MVRRNDILVTRKYKAKKELMEQEITGFSEEKLKEYEQRYHDLITKGRKENKKTTHHYAKTEEKTLLNSKRQNVRFKINLSVA